MEYTRAKRCLRRFQWHINTVWWINATTVISSLCQSLLRYSTLQWEKQSGFYLTDLAQFLDSCRTRSFEGFSKPFLLIWGRLITYCFSRNKLIENKILRHHMWMFSWFRKLSLIKCSQKRHSQIRDSTVWQGVFQCWKLTEGNRPKRKTTRENISKENCKQGVKTMVVGGLLIQLAISRYCKKTHDHRRAPLKNSVYFNSWLSTYLNMPLMGLNHTSRGFWQLCTAFAEANTPDSEVLQTMFPACDDNTSWAYSCSNWLYGMYLTNA